MRAVEKMLATKRLLSHLSRDFIPVAMFQSFSVEDMVLADLIYSDLVHQEYSNINMFTIDTGRLPDESHHLMEEIRERYGDILKVFYPNTSELEKFDAQFGVRRDYQNRSNVVRLLKPLERALQHHNAWITGSDALNFTIGSDSWISWDEKHQIPRFNPLSRWTKEEIQSYSKHHGLPVHGYLVDAHQRPQPIESGLWWWQPQLASWEINQNIA
jgi:phosphoadenosine phosphosulfate reductase